MSTSPNFSIDAWGEGQGFQELSHPGARGGKESVRRGFGGRGSPAHGRGEAGEGGAGLVGWRGHGVPPRIDIPRLTPQSNDASR